ncbi:hypothetical protein RBU00_25845 [Rhizobium sp. AN63]|uniref:hypothetical protein n=1 Tax=Rhizobium sp. AN63 TaxID=3035210 RepID=UPI0027D40266|nr:hypothetical protein [Rhizobium sp. AN63]MDQ4409147.1 hypothetical protein [Rhizobium sp. AN63]
MSLDEIAFKINRRRFVRLVTAFAGLMAANQSVLAAGDDAGIYDADVPKDWSFIRIASTDPSAVVTATIGEKPFKVSASGISDYIARGLPETTPCWSKGGPRRFRWGRDNI